MNKHFIGRFNLREENFFNVRLRKTDRVLNNGQFKVNLNNASKAEDLYYDEIIVYDGGGVDGYGG